MVLSVCSTVLEIFFSCMLIYCFISTVTVVYRQIRSSAILAKQLRFNQRGLTFQKYDKSAVVMLAAVVGFALVCSAIYMRCDFLQFFVNHPTQHFTPCKSDFAYKIPMLQSCNSRLSDTQI